MNWRTVGRGSGRAAVLSTLTRLRRSLAPPGSWLSRLALGPRRLSLNLPPDRSAKATVRSVQSPTGATAPGSAPSRALAVLVHTAVRDATPPRTRQSRGLVSRPPLLRSPGSNASASPLDRRRRPARSRPVPPVHGAVAAARSPGRCGPAHYPAGAALPARSAARPRPVARGAAAVRRDSDGPRRSQARAAGRLETPARPLRCGLPGRRPARVCSGATPGAGALDRALRIAARCLRPASARLLRGGGWRW